MPSPAAFLPVLPIGITMGCPVGIGPEIIVRMLSSPVDVGGRLVVLGDAGVLRRAARALAIDIPVREWEPGQEIEPGTIPVLPLSRLDAEKLAWGRPDRETGRAMGAYIEEAVRLIQAGVLGAMVTAPIGKKPLQEAGYPYPGHTEMLAALCGADEYAMMLAGDRLRVTLVTIHMALAGVPAALTPEKVLRLIEITGRSLRRDFGVPAPRLAVAGLNPHAGECGLFGDEEERVIAPAVAAARRQGWQAAGPLPPDTVFHQAANGRYDAVVCMYHDQGLIPFKLLHFADGVNATLGLPIVRTSVDHGTAYDIAGKGVASPTSLEAACRLAARIAANRRRAAG
ncbi:MAG: 4-hydroxythreonine-4-phosphate dehydrogenase PdxA [Desulfobacteraceae bacterium]|nr:4-hydroxythreonine-4-phosphate dehydrogenase PdxA [Desulfobacteraceae bacterium]